MKYKDSDFIQVKAKPQDRPASERIKEYLKKRGKVSYTESPKQTKKTYKSPRTAEEIINEKKILQRAKEGRRKEKIQNFKKGVVEGTQRLIKNRPRYTAPKVKKSKYFKPTLNINTSRMGANLMRQFQPARQPRPKIIQGRPRGVFPRTQIKRSSRSFPPRQIPQRPQRFQQPPQFQRPQDNAQGVWKRDYSSWANSKMPPSNRPIWRRDWHFYSPEGDLFGNVKMLPRGGAEAFFN